MEISCVLVVFNSGGKEKNNNSTFESFINGNSEYYPNSDIITEEENIVRILCTQSIIDDGATFNIPEGIYNFGISPDENASVIIFE
ncbi:MAG: hypothetical protein IJ776_03540 [Paludibacteraceae bacterium]|nr:hypothetical protein [Paludibacteraceae bacterium]